MLSATFIFAPGTYDDDFHRLDAIIMAVAEANEGYKGCERWWNEDRTQRSVVYYFDSHAALRAFSTDETHKQAKKDFARWYEGYRVVIAEVLSTHSAGLLDHPLNN